MKSLRILLVLALCGGANLSQAMWLRACRAIASRLATRCAQPMQAVKAGFPTQQKHAASFRTELSNSLKKMSPFSRGLLLAGLIAPVATAASVYESRTTQSFDFPSKRFVTVKGIIGDINVEGWDKEKIEIRTIKKAETLDCLNRTTVRAEADKNDASITTLHQCGEHTYHSDTLASCSHLKHHAKVEYQLRIPANSSLSVKTLQGNITVTGIRGSVKAHAMDITTTGCANVTAKAEGNVTLINTSGKAYAESFVGNASITQSLWTQWTQPPLSDATAISKLGNASISGALAGKALSEKGQAYFK